MEFDRDSFNHEVGLLLQLARKRRRLKQSDLAEMIGVPRATYASIESGRQRVHLDVVWRAAVVLNVPFSSLIPAPANSMGDGAELGIPAAIIPRATTASADRMGHGFLTTVSPTKKD